MYLFKKKNKVKERVHKKREAPRGTSLACASPSGKSANRGWRSGLCLSIKPLSYWKTAQNDSQKES